MLKLGKSKPWPFALEKITGSKEMSATSIKEYFQPLQEWLVKERCRIQNWLAW
jgi:peptidyl-dipeptidase A